MNKKFYHLIFIIGIILIALELIIILTVFVYFLIIKNNIQNKNIEFYKKLTDNYINVLQNKIAENNNLKQQLIKEQELVDSFRSNLNSLTNQVNLIIKLRNLDPELLKKYSKVYFLNENYVPKSLSLIDPKYVNNPLNEDQYILSNVLPFLYALLEQAYKDGIDLKIRWAYRSFWEQYKLKSEDLMVYGSGANKFTADQGYSEHQLGTTVDFTTNAYKGNASQFSKTKAYNWLLNNAYKYGFILSYPKNNTYYVFEPWHWRFVGIQLATKLHNDNKNFYDLDQREIDQYLLYIFDW
jgi:D-alanyl-D-alanine carboxypeptidase